MGTWNNVDNLYIRYGTDEATVGVAGEYGTVDSGNYHVTEVKLDLSTLTDTAVIIDNNAIFPANAIVAKVETFAEVAATSSGTGTIDVGLVKLSDRTTEIDFEAFIKDGTLANCDALGETVVLTKGVATAGDKMGTTVGTAAGLITANYNTAAFQTGTLKIKIYWYKA